MSQTLDQIYISNPITTNASTDLMYFSQSPYTAGHDAGMTYANFAAQFPPLHGVVLLSPAAAQTILTYQLNVPGGISTPEIIDANANEILALTPIAGAVNYLEINNNSTTNAPNIVAAGTDTNININFLAKGNGVFEFATSGTGVFAVDSGTHTTFLDFPSSASTTTITFPDATGTVALTSSPSSGYVLLAPSGLQTITTYDLVINGVRAGQGVGSSATNTVFGATALAGTNTNTDVVAIGASALNASTGSAADITAVGYNALLLATAPGANTTAIGSQAISGSASYVGTDNTAIGFQSLKNCTTGIDHVAIGSGAMAATTSGTGCVAIGYQAMTGITTNGNSVAIGYQTLRSATMSGQNVAVGGSAISSASYSGSNSTGVGHNSMFAVTAGIQNTCLGALTANNTPSGSANLTTGSQNTLIGYAASVNNLAATGTIALGASSIGIIASGATSGDNGPGISFGSTVSPVGFRGDGTIYTGGTGRGYWRPNLNGTPYLLPCFVDGTLTTDAVMITDANGSPILLANSGTPGYVLTANSGAPPSWQAITAEGAITTINGDTGSATASGGAVTINGGSTGLTTSGASHTLSLTGTLIVGNGGTGLASLTAYTLLAGGTTSTGVMQQVTAGTTGQLLQSTGASSLPAWTTATFPATAGSAGTILRSNGTNWVNSTSTFADTYGVSTILYASGSNAVSGLATANSAALVTNGSGVPAWQAMTAGQILIGTTAGAPAAAAINSGSGILVANSSGAITISATGGGIGWVAAPSTPVTAAINTGYYVTDASQVTFTLPTTAAAGSVVSIVGTGAGGWILQPGAGQTIQCLTQTASTSVTSAERYDCITVLCTVANTTWVATNMVTTGFTVA